MACWNDKREGSLLIDCPICGIKLAKKKRTYHVTECYERHSSLMIEMGLIKCPLNRLHIIPIVNLNHHLEGNCEDAQNSLRRYFQKEELRSEIKNPPESFLDHVHDEILNRHNKKLLYLLRKDLSGRDLSDNKDLYPDPEPVPSAAEAARPSAPPAQ